MKLVYFTIRLTPHLKRIIRREARGLKVGTSTRIRTLLETWYQFELMGKK